MNNDAFFKVGVYILNQVYTADIVYTYRASSEKASGIRRGTVVGLPFGGGNRLVYGIAQSDPVPASQQECKGLKEICVVLDNDYALSNMQVGLCEHLKSRIMCTFGEAAQLCLPKGLKIDTQEYFTPGERYDKLNSFEALPEEKPLLSEILQQIKDTGSANLHQQLCQKLTAKKILKKNTRLGYNINRRTEKYVVLGDKEAADRLLHKKTRANYQKYCQVVDYLSGACEPVLLKLVSQIYDVPASVFSTLEKHGAIKITRREVLRDASVTYAGTRTFDRHQLSPEQQSACDTLFGLMDGNTPQAALLYGVTGSGKTEVMLRLCDKALDNGKSVIYLVPEISLTGQTARLMFERYGDKVAIMHSGLSEGERHDAWLAVKRGQKRIVLGTRSAIFMPCENLGLIVLDEEQDDSYRSDTSPRYHARDVARYLCGRSNAVMLLASATPSPESFYKAQSGIYTLVRLKSRFGGATLPSVIIEDIRQDLETNPDRLIGSRLKAEIEKNLADSRQTILFMNRRGFGNFTVCASCGSTVKCPNCSVSLTVHGSPANRLMCHYCGYTLPYPEKCPSCGSQHMLCRGSGTEKLEAELNALFPNARVLRLDADSAGQKDAHRRILGSFADGQADILVGTQMVAKGHDFPNVTLVGVILAESSLYISDYRANERTFTLLTQVIGRAGRAQSAGRAVIQTLSPYHEVLSLAADQDYDSFYRGEIALRRALQYPPVCDICVMTLHSRDEQQLSAGCQSLNNALQKAIAESPCKMMVFGPVQAPIYRLRGVYRMRFIIKFKNNPPSRDLFNKVFTEFTRTLNKDVKLTLDINPASL